MKRFSMLAALVTALMPGVATAQNVPCNLSPEEWNETLAEFLIGTWTVWNGPGVATLGGQVIPLPPDSVGTMSIAVIDGELTAFGQGVEASADFEVEWVSDEVWADLEPVTPDVATLGDMVLTVGSDCDAGDLPQLRLMGSFPVQGQALQVTMDVVVIDESNMWGRADYFLGMGAANLEGQRITSLTR